MNCRMDAATKLPQETLKEEAQDQCRHSQRPYAEKRVGLYWDAPRKYNDCLEEDVCKCLARSLSDQGMGNIRGIRKYHHPNSSDKDFPDCLASMDDKKLALKLLS